MRELVFLDLRETYWLMANGFLELAQIAYNESIKLFVEADDEIDAQEIRNKLQGLDELTANQALYKI